MERNIYYSLVQNGETANINIYGDITSFPFPALGEVGAFNLSKQLEALENVTKINVYINSYGGEVAEGLAIYNALRRHKAKITTYCDGFAASIASVIFMAGDERIMNESSLLMIHNSWRSVSGNAAELRKHADDLDKITTASVKAYKANSTLTEEEIHSLMDAETWILPDEAISYGFATKIERNQKETASQNAFKKLFEIIKAHQAAKENTDTETEEPENETPEESETEPEAEPDEETEDEADGEDKKTGKEAVQNWIGFFNAIKN